MEFRRPTPLPRIAAKALLTTLRHHRWSRPLLALLLIAICLASLRAAHRRIEIASAAWSPHTVGWVATTALDAGHRLDDGDVVRRSLPAGALPRDATTGSPIGQHLADAMAEGEILRDGRLGDRFASANGSLVGAGRGAISLTTPTPHLAVGDRVHLYSLFTGTRVAARAEVIAIVDDLAVVAVGEDSLASVISAFSVGDLVPALVG